MIYIIILINTLLLVKFCRTKKVQALLKLLLLISYYGWHVMPLVLTDMGYASIWSLSYGLCCIVDELFMMLVILASYIFIKKLNLTPFAVCKQFKYENNPKAYIRIFYVLLFLLSYECMLAMTSDISYLDGNSLDYTESRGGLSVLSYFTLFAKVGIVVYLSLFRDILSRRQVLLSFSLLSVTCLIHVLGGGRIQLFTILYVLIYWAIEKKQYKYLIVSIAGCFIFLSLLPALGSLRSSGSFSISDVAKEGTSSKDKVLKELVTKTNSVNYGSYLIDHEGIGAGGTMVYYSTLFALVPRIIYPSKPEAGSKDGTQKGLPARLSGAYSNTGAYNGISNNGVSTSIEALWALGWIMISIQALACAYLIYLFNCVFYSRNILLCIFSISLISVPICIIDISLVSMMMNIPRYAILYWIITKLCKLKKY